MQLLMTLHIVHRYIYQHFSWHASILPTWGPVKWSSDTGLSLVHRCYMVQSQCFQEWQLELTSGRSHSWVPVWWCMSSKWGGCVGIGPAGLPAAMYTSIYCSVSQHLLFDSHDIPPPTHHHHHHQLLHWKETPPLDVHMDLDRITDGSMYTVRGHKWNGIRMVFLMRLLLSRDVSICRQTHLWQQ